jgi:hypothetical protein
MQPLEKEIDFTPLFEEIIALLERADGPPEQAVAKFQTRQIALCMRRKAQGAEMIPIDTLLAAARPRSGSQ